MSVGVSSWGCNLSFKNKYRYPGLRMLMMHVFVINLPDEPQSLRWPGKHWRTGRRGHEGSSWVMRERPGKRRHCFLAGRNVKEGNDAAAPGAFCKRSGFQRAERATVEGCGLALMKWQLFPMTWEQKNISSMSTTPPLWKLRQLRHLTFILATAWQESITKLYR